MPDSDLPWVPSPGDVLAGKYQVEALVGAGGMGAVVTAVQRELGRRVAIKLMPPHAARSPLAVERFLREARAASAINSDHVVRVFDVGRRDDGTPFMVMEYLAGATLDRVVATRGPMPVAEAVDYVLQACTALAECHGLGIVHRDLKPENIMLVQRPGQSGFVKILDFGISKTEWMSQESSFNPGLTGTTDVFGTPTHMSPEQVRSSKAVDNRADIWALGVVMYEILTGAPPFMADTLPALSAMIVSDDPIHPCLRRPDLPSELAAVVLMCLAKSPGSRPQSVAQLAELLRPFCSAGSIAHVDRIRSISAADPFEASRPWPRAMLASRPTDSAWGTTRRRATSSGRTVAIGVGAGVVLFGVLLVGLSMMRGRGDPVLAASADRPARTAEVPTSRPAAPIPPAPIAVPTAQRETQTPDAAAPASSSTPPPKRPKLRTTRDKALDERF
ncbi:MAG: serine/threonine-protein kinase [Polyangiaceae bacterium]